LDCNFQGNCDTECSVGAIERMRLVAMPDRKPADRNRTGLETGHYEEKAAPRVPHSKTARIERRPLQRRLTVAGFGCDIWGTNGWRRSYHLQARGCVYFCGVPSVKNGI